MTTAELTPPLLHLPPIAIEKEGPSPEDRVLWVVIFKKEFSTTDCSETIMYFRNQPKVIVLMTTDIPDHTHR